MALPTQKRSTSRQKRRTSLRKKEILLKKKNLFLCPQCKRKILPHRVCPYCGYYKGKEVLKIKIKGKNK